MSATISNLRTHAPKGYKKLLAACFVVAGLALGVGTALDRQLVGVGLYVVLMAVGAVSPHLSEDTLFDERDDAIHRRASGQTLALFGWGAALGYPSLVVLSTTPYFEWGPASGAVAVTTLIVYGTYTALLLYHR